MDGSSGVSLWQESKLVLRVIYKTLREEGRREKVGAIDSESLIALSEPVSREHPITPILRSCAAHKPVIPRIPYDPVPNSLAWSPSFTLMGVVGPFECSHGDSPTHIDFALQLRILQIW